MRSSSCAHQLRPTQGSLDTGWAERRTYAEKYSSHLHIRTVLQVERRESEATGDGQWQHDAVHPSDLTVEAAVARARTLGPEYGIYVSTRFEEALEEAARSSGTGPLSGIPYGLKDEFDTPDLPTSGGSWRYRDRHTPGVKSAPYRAFESAGAVMLGKTNLSDFGLVPEATSYVGGSALNPFDSTRTAGGSSGGSAAAVALGLHGFDWGTDIGGSIRLPAAFCGVLGLKLSDEVWPHAGALSARAALVSVDVRARAIRADHRSTPNSPARGREPVLRTGPTARFHPERIAIYAPTPGAWPTFTSDVSPVVSTATDLPIVRADLPPPRKILRHFVAVWASHFMDLLPSDPQLELWSGVRAAVSAVVARGRFGDKRFHPMTAELLLLFAASRLTWARSRKRARQRADAIRERFRALWADGAVIVAPVVVHPPPKVGTSTRNPELLMYTCPGNLADATGLSLPFGTFDGRLPRAIQLLGPPGSENALLDLADQIIRVRNQRVDLRPRAP